MAAALHAPRARRRPRALQLRLLLCLVPLLSAGCAGMDVRMLATGTASPAYELQGERLSDLEAQARRLCPSGVDFLQRWEHRPAHPGEAGLVRRWMHAASQALPGAQPDQARLLVQCHAAR